MANSTDQTKKDGFKRVVAVLFLAGFFIFIIQMGMLVSRLDDLKPRALTGSAPVDSSAKIVEQLERLNKNIEDVTTQKNIGSPYRHKIRVDYDGLL